MLDLVTSEGLSKRNYMPQALTQISKRNTKEVFIQYRDHTVDNIIDCLHLQYLKIHLDALDRFGVISEPEQVYITNMQHYLDRIGKKLDETKVIPSG